MNPLRRGQRPSSVSNRTIRTSAAIAIEALEPRTLLSSVGSTIGGTVYNDLNANGVKNHGEPGLAGWQVYVDANNNGQLDAGEQVAVTDANGNWSLSGLAAGTYAIREVPQSSWRQTTAPVLSVHVGQHSNVHSRNFGNTQAASISGTVFVDANGNGVQDAGEAGLRGCRLFIDLNNSGHLDHGDPVAVSGPGGAYLFHAVNPGSMTLHEVVKHGYTITLPSAGAYALNLSPLQVSTGNDFGNAKVPHPAPPTKPPPNPGGNPPPTPGDPPPVNDGFIISSHRAVWQVDSSKDIITFYAKDPGTGSLAGSSRLVGEDITLSSASGLVIRASGGNADLTGSTITPTASHISLGTGFFAASADPASGSMTFTDMQLIAQFEVSGALVAGAVATGTPGAVIAVAVVPHGAAVTISGQLAADMGPILNISDTV